MSTGRGFAVREGWQQLPTVVTLPFPPGSEQPNERILHHPTRPPRTSVPAPPAQVVTVRDAERTVVGLPEKLPADPTALAHLLVRLIGEVRDLLAGQQPSGVVVGSSVSTSSTTPNYLDFLPPLFSLELTNDGPDTLEYQVPKSSAGSFNDLNAGETVRFAAIVPVLGSLGYRLKVAGGSVSFRVVGLY